MRLLLDNNVLVSALIAPRNAPGQLLRLWKRRHYELITSAEQIERLRAVLAREKITKLIGTDLSQELLVQLSEAAEIVEPKRDIDLTADEEDNLILGAALAGKADLLVTGDKKHLLPLKQVEGVGVVSVHEAIELLTRSTDDECVS